MKEEKTEKDFLEAQEAEPEKEKAKKIFIIFIALLLLGGTCYYYAKSNILSFGIKKQVQGLAGILSVSGKKPLEQLNKIQKAEKISEVKIVQKKDATESAPEKIISTKLKPTDKSTFLSLTGKSSGKHDPFSYSESKFVPFTSESGENPVSLPGRLPPVPGSGRTGNLPSLPGVPGMIPSSGLAQPPAPKPEDLIVVKGFIGNKVIVEIDGVVEALSENEKINNTKVLSVDRPALTAKFEINGKFFTKTLKSLTGDYNGSVQLVKS